MSPTAHSATLRDEALFHVIADAIDHDGYIVLPGGFDIRLTTALLAHLQALRESDFKRGGIGRELDHHVNPFIRKDRVGWLEPNHPTVDAYFAWCESLRLWLNRHLFLGLFDYECHYASYPHGAFYKKHLDAFQGNTNRRLTTVLYLNPEWGPNDGGELLLYHPERAEPLARVLPGFATLVIFLSEVFPHEVLPTQRSRFSLTGWYRINAGSELLA